jgi:sucrose-6-phosphate hydrolase SacC (GH32 family)
MWECPDFFPLNVSSAGTSEDHAVVWVMKYSIGPGPSYEIPWGIPQPTDYYTTGTYDSSSFTGYDVNKYIYDEAMLRSKAVVLDNGAFYASKTFLFERSGDECSEAVCGERLLWGWVPEERPVDGRGQPFGWAGVMALPRTVRAYQKASAQAPSDPWYLQTQVVESVMTELRIDSSYTALESFTLNGSNSGHGHMQLDGVTGSQLDVQLKLDVKSMSIGSQCGLRVLSAFDGSEYTVVGLHLPHDDTSEGLVRAFVDTSHSCSDASAEVNRTSAFSASMALRDAAAEPSASVVNMRVIVDRSVIELFFADGKQVITRRVYPNSPDSSIQVFAFVSCEDDLNCECSFERVDAWRLRHANITTLDDNADDSPPPSDDEGGSDGNDQDEDTLSEIIGIPSWAAVSVIVVLGVCLVVGIVKFRDHYKRAQDDYRVDRPAAQDDANADYMQPLMVSA